MGTACPPLNKQEHHPNSTPLQCDEYPDVQSLIEENARLRGLVVKLSDLVLRNLVDRR
jgi:hypothetical protein